ncbi:YdcF family protein [Magnetovibrio sp. PR-2]|uniref:YdcF family protein n=1 Tax=Magnetovibrio sp. PR-2 TaxID=3120356 RepID=UPI002FCE07FF
MNPYTLFITGLSVGLALQLTRSAADAGRRLIGLVVVCYVVFAILPTGQWALNQLEERFPRVTQFEQPIAGILVLGGSVNTVMTRERGQVSLGGNVERLTEFYTLSRLYPEAKLAFIGGQGRVFDRKPTEAEVSHMFLKQIGMNTQNIWFDLKSRNTEEGAKLGYHHLKPGNDPWVLVTSASHMPRAVGLFRKAGWNIIAYPVDYKTLPGTPKDWWPNWPGDLHSTGAALYEIGGLVYAYWRGKTEELFPSPAQQPKG